MKVGSAERRRLRLREEMIDESVPLPTTGWLGDRLVEELTAALYPARHEGRTPRYGAIVCPTPDCDLSVIGVGATVVASGGVADDELRLFADGRGAFVFVTEGHPRRLACFERTIEYEATAMRLALATGAYIVQRALEGRVRVIGPEGVVEWEAGDWRFKPLASQYLIPICRLVPQVDADVLGGLLELCVHWLSAGRVGSTIVWCLPGVDPHEIRHVDRSASVTAPPLRITERSHFPALLSALAQLDRAAILDADGRLVSLGVTLTSSDAAERLVPPVGGTRHSSARRFSFAEPGALVFVVSDDGRVSVYSDGALATEIRGDPCNTGAVVRPPLPDRLDRRAVRSVTCSHCNKLLLVDVVDVDGWTGGPEELPCPVCGTTIVVPVYRAAIRGVRKVLAS